VKTAVLAIAASLALVGCGETQGPGGAPRPSFAKINTDVFEPNCTYACHSGGEFAAGGLDMKADPYRTLVGVRAVAAVCKSSPMVRVAPGQPDESLVYLKVAAKLEGKPAPCGDGMPAGVDRPALTADEVDAIRAWIEDGAPDD
jgi:hypothetical protein